MLGVPYNAILMVLCCFCYEHVLYNKLLLFILFHSLFTLFLVSRFEGFVSGGLKYVTKECPSSFARVCDRRCSASFHAFLSPLCVSTSKSASSISPDWA